MIRTIIAAALLRTTGAQVEYRVQRRTTDKPHDTDGRTFLRTPSYRAALRKYRSMRAGTAEVVTIRLVALTRSRQGEVEAEA